MNRAGSTPGQCTDMILVLRLKAVRPASLQICRSLPLECPPREHQGEGLHSVFQTFAENPFLYPGMIVNAIVYVRRRWCVSEVDVAIITVCVCFFFLLSLFVTLYIFLHLTVLYSSTFGKGWVGMSACPLVVLACDSLHVCTVCIWRCEHARFCVEVFLCAIYKFSFIHSFIQTILQSDQRVQSKHKYNTEKSPNRPESYTALTSARKTYKTKSLGQLIH